MADKVLGVVIFAVICWTLVSCQSESPKRTTSPPDTQSDTKPEIKKGPLAAHKAPQKTRAQLKKQLTPLQYRVTQEDGTEPPFKNKYWNNKEPGIYVDIVSGEPLFSSTDKFQSGTGWPSFTKPLHKNSLAYKEDFKLWAKRIEVRSRKGDSHLGHVFEDGPQPTGKRYCINSAALRFVPVKDLKKEGLGQYLALFNAATPPTKEKK